MTSQYTAMRKAHRELWGRWYKMCKRCNDNERYYHDVKVCDDWNKDISGELGFINFVTDMGDDFREELVLDRIDPKGNYDAHNCRWTTTTENNRNQRYHKYTERGRYMALMMEKWGHSTKSKQRFWSRLNRGWSYEETLNVPPHKMRHRSKPKPKYFGKIIGWFKSKTSV
jgi:hypothetical protein